MFNFLKRKKKPEKTSIDATNTKASKEALNSEASIDTTNTQTSTETNLEAPIITTNADTSIEAPDKKQFTNHTHTLTEAQHSKFATESTINITHQENSSSTETSSTTTNSSETNTLKNSDPKTTKLNNNVSFKATNIDNNASSKNQPSDSSSEKKGFFSRLKSGLTKTRANFANGLATIFLGKKTLDTDTLDLIETQLLTADLGVDATQHLINNLTQQLARKELNNTQAALACLQTDMKAILQPCEKALTFNTDKKPYVILVVGINGSGKTTTIGKLAKHLQASGKSVMLAAGDTFRAAAIEQLQVWGERNQIPVISQQPGADTAAVIYDSLESAKARGVDVLIADTAGRLHTQTNLMEELKKVKRVLGKIDPSAPHETLLVLDAGIGQNALNQAKQFHEAIGLTGLALTKLDGTAKGGIIFAIAKHMQLPIRFIGVGEGIDDLRPFNANEFVNALFESSE